MIIAISNQKGGVGKTTTACSLAYGLQTKGYKVLLVDDDPQGNSSGTYRANKEDGYPSLSDLLYSNAPEVDCIQHTEIGDILAADSLLDDAETNLKGFAGFFRLKRRLEPLKALYDHIIIDTPPNFGILQQNALIAADGVIVPITCDQYTLEGMSKFIDTVVDIKSQPNPDLKILGLLITMYSPNTLLAKEVVESIPDLEKRLGTEIFDTKIRYRKAVGNSQAAKLPLQLFAPKSDVTKDYMDLIEELGGII